MRKKDWRIIVGEEGLRDLHMEKKEGDLQLAKIMSGELRLGK